MRYALFILAFIALILFDFFLFINKIPDEEAMTNEGVDAIIVWTGDYARIKTAFLLHERNENTLLFISGAYDGASLEEIRIASGYDKPPKEKLIHIGRQARDTIGNAQETADFVREHNIGKIYLITSNYHIPRSLYLLKKQNIPNLQVFPIPVFHSYFTIENWWKNRDSLEMIISEYSKFFASRLMLL